MATEQVTCVTDDDINDTLNSSEIDILPDSWNPRLREVSVTHDAGQIYLTFTFRSLDAHTILTWTKVGFYTFELSVERYPSKN